MRLDPLLLAGLAAVFGAILCVLIGFLPRSGKQRAVSRSLAAVRAMSVGPVNVRDQELQSPFVDRAVTPVLDRLTGLGNRLTPDRQIDGIRRRLDLAGNPPGWDADRVVASKVLGLFLGAALAIAVTLGLGAGTLPALGLLIAGLLVGWYAPTLWLYQVAYNRSEQIRADLPDILDLLTISVEAGLSFEAALSQVAEADDGPLARELFRVLQEMQIGTGRADALRALGERTDVAELRSFVSATVQAEGYGVPIANVLRIQSHEMRIKRGQHAEELAQKVPVKILFPLIFCIMPALFVVIMGPAAITVMDSLGGP
jgi:tight adherence protein C